MRRRRRREGDYIRVGQDAVHESGELSIDVCWITMVVLAWLCLAVAAGFASSVTRREAQDDPLGACPGYKASNVQITESGLTASLSLAGPECNVYGDDLLSLILEVVYETGA